MSVFKHILFVSNPEQNQDNAIALVKRVAKAMNAKVSLMTVLKKSSSLLDLSGGLEKLMQEQLEETAQAQLCALAGHFDDIGIGVTTAIRWGNTSIEASRYASEGDIDLVAINATSGGSLNEYFFGTTAMQLIRRCPRPVWAIHKNAQYPKHVMTALDLQGELDTNDGVAHQLLETSHILSEQMNAQLHLGCAWALENEGYLNVRGGVSNDELAQVNQRLERKLESKLDGLIESEAELSRLAPKIHLRHGEPHTVLNALVQEKHIDLMMMATMNRKGVEGLLIGNTAESLLQHAPCSLLVIKPQGAALNLDAQA